MKDLLSWILLSLQLKTDLDQSEPIQDPNVRHTVFHMGAFKVYYKVPSFTKALDYYWYDTRFNQEYGPFTSIQGAINNYEWTLMNIKQLEIGKKLLQTPPNSVIHVDFGSKKKL